jgi:hypothetical protein
MARAPFKVNLYFGLLIATRLAFYLWREMHSLGSGLTSLLGDQLWFDYL